MNLGLSIRIHRAGYTQREIAAKTGVTNSYISRIERGHKEPSLTWLTSFATFCGVTVSEIFNTAEIVERHGLQYKPGSIER